MKKRTASIVFLFLLMGLFGVLTFCGEEASAATVVSGTIYDSAGGPWTPAGSPYWVVGDIPIPAGEPLTVAPGTEVRFEGYHSINADGSLLAVGSAGNLITFTSNSSTPARADWNRIIAGSTGHLQIEHCNISYGDAAITIASSYNNVIRNSILTYNDWAAIRIVDAGNHKIADNIITHNGLVGLLLDSSSGNDVVDNYFDNVGATAITLVESSSNAIRSNSIRATRLNGKGLWIWGSGNYVVNNTITSTHWAITLYFSSGNYIYHNRFLDNAVQVESTGSNIWDDGYPSGGNHWMFYYENDLLSGPNQDIPGGDGIGDVEFVTDGNNDRYPLMSSGYFHPLDNAFPSPVDDLVVSGVTTISAVLSWTAPGDDGMTGTAMAYDVRHSTSGPIDDAAWDAAIQVPDEPAPQPAGSPETLEVLGLLPDTQYWFAIKSSDETLTPSPISNSPNAATQTPESEPPSITDLSVIPQVQLPNRNVNVSAEVSDNAQVYRVSLEIIDPYSINLGNFSMGFDSSSGRYHCNRTYYDLGEHLYTMWAEDSSHNFASLSGSFYLRQEIEPPTITSIDVDPPQQLVYEDVVFMVTATDNVSVSTVSLLVMDPADGLVGNFTMSRIVSTDDFRYIGSFGPLVGVYTFTIWARDVTGNMASSPGSFMILELPDAPAGLDSSSGDSYVELTWDPPPDDGGSPITNYTIFRGTSSGGEVFLVEIGNTTQYNDTAVNNGVTYYYKVAAKTAMGEGPRSDEVSAMPATTPGAPVGLVVTTSNQQAVLTWLPPTDDGGQPVTNYTINRGTTQGAGTLVGLVGIVLTFTDTGLTNEVVYYYSVAAINAVGEGARSAEVSGTVRNIIPTCSVQSPSVGSRLSGVVHITGTAGDSDGAVAAVEVSVDGGAWSEATGNLSWSFDLDTTSLSNGEHTITARSYDGFNHSSTVSVTITVANPVESRSLLEEGWFWIVVVVIIAVVVLALVVIMKRRAKE